MATALTTKQVQLWEGNDPVAKDLSLATLLNTIISELATATATNATNTAKWAALGLDGKKVVFGEASFSTSDVTVEIDCFTKEGVDLTVIEAIVLLPKEAWAATELLYYDGVVTVNGGAGDNTTTITRLAGTTSALKFGFILIGS